MAMRVVRKDLDGRDSAPAAWCAEPHVIVRELGVLTVEEQIAILVAQDELVEGASSRRAVFKENAIVGYIEIVDDA